jgi:hypothetical protein
MRQLVVGFALMAVAVAIHLVVVRLFEFRGQPGGGRAR